MHKLLLFSILLAFLNNFNVLGQNLIENYSFEQYSPFVWNTILTVDLLQTNQPCQEGIVYATHGIRCVGLRFRSQLVSDWQEYITQIVYGDFEAGKTYKISFNYKLSNRCIYSTDDLGVGFIHDWIGSPSQLQNQIDAINPVLKNPENAILSNYNQYNEFSQYYTATGTETYIVIGCFKKDYNLTYVPINNPTSNPFNDLYFFIDEVEVYACPPMPENLLENMYTVCDDQPFELSTTVSADSYLWSNDSTSNSTQISVDEDIMWLEATFGNCKLRDTTIIQRFSGPSDLGPTISLCGPNDFPIGLKIYAKPNETVVWNTGENSSSIVVTQPGLYSVQKSIGECVWMDQVNVIDLMDEIVLHPNPASKEIHFKDENNITITSIFTEDGKKLTDSPLSIFELNSLISTLQPAIYLLDVERNSCKKRLKLSLITN